nr:YqaA family protein [Thaumasiovibrio subtropicus]
MSLESIVPALTALFVGESGLWVLFVTGFLSATLLPGGSEAAFLAAMRLGDNSLMLLIVVATIGNTLGGMTNYWLGRLLPDKTSDEKHGHKAMHWLKQHGYWALLFSWLPVIGDPLCLAAGWLRLNHSLSFFVVLIGKALRYTALAMIFKGIL